MLTCDNVFALAKDACPRLVTMLTIDAKLLAEDGISALVKGVRGKPCCNERAQLLTDEELSMTVAEDTD